ncbi:SDR family oxidoreductase [Aquamicrobium sp.]|uniref:SDR family NAD(P)-dependent oxidoreductase n=1 Tax=Aquamicrobium sp. TaxID=1872579 RepID=UPI0025871BB0|nr:SDR family oxidoreductase [Aquamicrobium sp.]MCK9550202.1 SDR family oxidoreductase [Aquamicrobium sp.]
MSSAETVVITGSTSGIGKAIALRYARDGANVIISGRNGERGAAVANNVRELGGQALYVPTELSDPASIEAMAGQAAKAFGPVDILVNAGGILQSGKAVLEQTLEEHQALWDVNYLGTLLACQVFGRAMKEHGKGAIMNIGSLASLAPLSLPAYTPGKAAVWSLTQILAAELGPFGIRVNAVAPGYTLSDGLREKIRLGQRDPEAIKETTALRAFVKPEDVAEAVHFLCSGMATSITGVMLPIDAGWLVHAPYASYKQGNPIRPLDKRSLQGNG